jgi:signal transduction histidine kinase
LISSDFSDYSGGAMIERQRLFLLIAIMMVVAIGVAGIAIRVLYSAALEKTGARLVETVQTQAALLEGVAQFNAQHNIDEIPGGIFAATLGQIGFGETGEFSLAKREEEMIVFLLRQRHYDLEHPAPVPFSWILVEPMRRALSGESGMVVGLDYRGEEVLAAYEPIRLFDLGIVAQIDLAEVRAPFIRAGKIAGGVTLVLIFLGALLFGRMTNPFIRNLERRVAERTADLARANRELHSEIAERKLVEEQLLVHQNQLRSLASELMLTEERERHHIATDLHDHIGQILAVTQMKIDALQVSVGSAGQTESLDEISGLIDQMDEGIRSLTFELSPPVLYELGLTAGLEWLAEEFEAKHALRIEVVDDGQSELIGEDVRALIFRAVRELLINVVKHARAHTVRVTLLREETALHAEVVDDGVGFDSSTQTVPKKSTGGFGLFSIRERMGSIGGSFQIDSKPGRGTRALLIAPLRGTPLQEEGETNEGNGR